MNEVRFLGIDFGHKRIGLALSDPTGLIAQPLETLTVKGQKQARQLILEIIDKHEVTGVVFGLPLNMSGEPSEMSGQVEEFAEKLKANCLVTIYFEDERLSSRQAEAILHSHGKGFKGNKKKIDRIAATIILQSFLDRRRMSQSRDTE